MKQDPRLSSIHIAETHTPPEQMVPSLGKIGSPDYMIGESLIAFLLHGLCVLIALWCMDIPKHENPLHSTIEVAFETPVILPVPQDVDSLNRDDIQVPVAEPSVKASESLPPTDLIATISVSKLPKPALENKKNSPQSSQHKVDNETDIHTDYANKASIKKRAVSSSNQAASKKLSPTQRCSALSNNYPVAARRRHEQGTVHVRYQLLADGQVKQVEVVESSGFSDLDHAAVKAVQTMQCQAALGQPVIKAVMPVHFSLNKIQ